MSTESRESGQAAIPLVVFFSLFLLTAAGLAVDVSSLLFHRQAAQSAADAACQAASLDLLESAVGQTPAAGITPGQAGSCSAGSTSSLCLYAKYNGYAGGGSSAQAGTSAWNTVNYSFPQGVTGVVAPSPNLATTPFLNVSITESVPTYLVQLVPGSHFSQVKAQCTCGLSQVSEPAPMVVLAKTGQSFKYSGGAGLNIVGGPQRGLQVNSTSATAIGCSPSGTINTSQGGPSVTGSDVGIVGPEPQNMNGCQGQTTQGFSGGSTGNWRQSVLPMVDPFASVGPPASVKKIVPATYNTNSYQGLYPNNIWVNYKIDGCPDQTSSAYVGQTGTTSNPANCAEYAPGYYPNGITLPNSYSTIIFLPGVYYLNGSLTSSGSNTLRMALPCWASYSAGYSAAACSTVSKANNLKYTQGAGVMFYFLSGTFNVSGGLSGDKIDTVSSTELTCDGTVPAANLKVPAQMSGNVLWGQCTQNGTYYDTGGDTTDVAATNPGTRGLLFFQDHGNTASPTFTGSGALSFAGSFYFHSNSYGDVLSLSGGTSTGNFIIGDIVADQVNLSGSGLIGLAIPPTLSVPMLKVAAFQ